MVDERTRYFRRLRRLRGAARRWTVLAAGLATSTAVIVPYQGIGAADAVWAGLAGATGVMAWWRWQDARQLAASPAPAPPHPALAGERWLSALAQVPGGYALAEGIRRQRLRGALRGSAAADMWERLDRAARSMQRLTVPGSAALDSEAAEEAAGVERQLRELTDRVAGLEEALKLAPAEAVPPLRELRDDHLRQMAEGVEAYEQFVVAAAGYLSESARAGDPGTGVAGLTAATEKLRGVTSGLTELRTRYGDLRITG